MAAFTNTLSSLPNIIDVGDDIYSLVEDKSIKLAYKSRKQFIDTFGTDPETERLLRKYLYFKKTPKNKFKFASSEDKNKLITILKNRSKSLKNSIEFTSSTINHIVFNRFYLNIEQLIKDIENPSGTNVNADDETCIIAKKEIKEMSSDIKFQMILEMAWYLLHPDMVSSEVGCKWAKMIKELDRLYLGDIVAEIRKAQEEKGIEPSKNAFNYFKKINLETVAKKDNITNALQQAKKLAIDIQSESAAEDVKKRLTLLLNILEMKKYLSKDQDINEDRMKTIERSMITNPMKGGTPVDRALDKSLSMAMKPLFDYFKVVYDPIYTFLKESINKNNIIIPELTMLLYICNELNKIPIDDKSIRLYRITNVNKKLLEFINDIINKTKEHVGNFTKDKNYNIQAKKAIFNKQLFKLPKVRLTSLLGEAFLSPNAGYIDPDTFPYIQIFTMETNIKYHTNPPLNESINNVVKKFFDTNNIYILLSKSDNINIETPLNVYSDIDYNTIDVSKKTIDQPTLLDNYFKNKSKPDDPVYFKNLVDTSEYVVYNDAELALSIFIALEELMPK